MIAEIRQATRGAGDLFDQFPDDELLAAFQDRFGIGSSGGDGDDDESGNLDIWRHPEFKLLRETPQDDELRASDPGVHATIAGHVNRVRSVTVLRETRVLRGFARSRDNDLKIAEVGARSHHLATLLQKATMSSLHAEEKGVSYGDVLDGGVHGAGFFVLVGARMPAVLMEVSFISNPVEEGYLAKTDYRARVADAIVNALRAYRDGK